MVATPEKRTSHLRSRRSTAHGLLTTWWEKLSRRHEPASRVRNVAGEVCVGGAWHENNEITILFNRCNDYEHPACSKLWSSGLRTGSRSSRRTADQHDGENQCDIVRGPPQCSINTVRCSPIHVECRAKHTGEFGYSRLARE